MKNTKKILVACLILITFFVTLNYSEATTKNEENGIMLINEEAEPISVEESTEENENQAQILDTKATDGVYKLSEDNNIYLPFIRYAIDRIVLDKENNSSLGTLFSSSSIEVTQKQTGLKCLFATDTVRINAPMDYAIVFAGQNAVIDSQINNSLIIFGTNTVTFTENAKVNGDIICFASNLEFKGQIDGSILGTFSNVNISGTVNGDLRANCQNIEVSSNENVKKNIYIETYNNDIKLKETYPNAIVKILEQGHKISKAEVLQMVSKGLLVCLVFSLLYVLFDKKTKVIENVTKLAKEHPTFLLLTGPLSIIVCPLIILALLVAALLNFDFIALPILIIYLAFLLIAGLLSTFIVGSLMIKCISEKFIKDQNSLTKFGFSFLLFAVLYALARIPVIDYYVTVALVMISNGIILLRIFKNKKLKD